MRRWLFFAVICFVIIADMVLFLYNPSQEYEANPVAWQLYVSFGPFGIVSIKMGTLIGLALAYRLQPVYPVWLELAMFGLFLICLVLALCLAFMCGIQSVSPIARGG